MAAVTITGTLSDATGTGVANCILRLSPAAASEQAAEAISGVGMVLDPVESVTNASGVFSLSAVQGFRYRLEIPSIGWDREFVAPSVATIRFDLLGLEPRIDSVANGHNAAGETEVFVLIKSESVETVRERFDQIVLSRSPTTIRFSIERSTQTRQTPTQAPSHPLCQPRMKTTTPFLSRLTNSKNSTCLALTSHGTMGRPSLGGCSSTTSDAAWTGYRRNSTSH